MTRAQPVLGFPSKKHAIAALADRGLTIKEIAERIDSTTDAVRVALRQLKAPPAPTWSPERIEKAKRLIALTFDEIARAMSVPVADLQRLAADVASPFRPPRRRRRPSQHQRRRQRLTRMHPSRCGRFRSPASACACARPMASTCISPAPR